MKVILLSILWVVFSSCSGSPKATRTPASYHWRPGELSVAQSQIRLLSIKTVNKDQAYFFYFEGRDQFGDLIDFDPYELSFQTSVQELPFDYFRDNLGKYYYRIFFSSIPAQAQSIKVFLRGESISEIHLQHQERLAALDISQSRMKVIKYENHTYYFLLELLDSTGNLVNSRQKPEIMIEGDASLQDLTSQGPGKWLGELRIFDTNSIIYLSPRLNSKQLPRLLRIQHIEK